MKKLVLITALLFTKLACSDMFAQMSDADLQKEVLKPDTVFSVYLEEDTVYRFHSVFLVFENITGDSILLHSHFKLFREDVSPAWRWDSERGFKMNFYLDGGNKAMMPNWGQWEDNFYKFSDDKNDGRTLMPPHSIVRFRIPLPYPAGSSDKWELSFSINYLYVNLTKKNGRPVSMETNRLDLGYLNNKTKK
jgi:hypothetical protein